MDVFKPNVRASSSILLKRSLTVFILLILVLADKESARVLAKGLKRGNGASCLGLSLYSLVLSVSRGGVPIQPNSLAE
ncbi:hypothetical protein WG66_015081 [Moniliophthora roreri]|nr:hypothetical protein WG66_015081 [Moniliophthora roreri]